MKILMPFLILVIAGACASTGSLRALPEEAGDVQLFAGDVRAAALAARNAVVATPLEVVEARQRGPGTWYLIARGPGAVFVRVLCEQVQEDVVAIRIVMARADVFIRHEDWGPTLFAQLSLELDAVGPDPRDQAPGPGA